MRRLAIVTTHPIQYNAPFFKLLSQDDGFITKVFYTLGMEASGFTDYGFGKKITWDIPLLEGYDHTFVKNIALKPSTAFYKGIINPTLIIEIEAFEPTHILVYGWCFYSHLKVLRHFYKKAKILFRGDSTLLDEKPGIRTFLRRLWLFWLYRYVDVALYVGTNNKEYFIKHGLPEHKLFFSPHAVDNDRFSDEVHIHKAETIRHELGIGPDKTVLLFAGKFESKKNLFLLIEAFKLAKAHNTVLLIIGNGVLEKELIARASEVQNIRFLPFQNQAAMPAVYRVGDVLVLPSAGPGETWGLSMNEAMACGLAIVASDKVGGAIDLIKENDNGFIFNSGDKTALTKIFDKLASTPKGELSKMGKVSQMIIVNWSYNKNYEVIRGIINNT